MRVLAIVGSGREGNTLELTKNILKRMQAFALADGLEFEEEIIRLRELELPFCMSCHNCVTEKGDKYCPHRDVARGVEQKLHAADGIILASPVYSLQVSGLMKNLIDHFSFYFHRPCLFDKCGLALTNTAGAGHKASGKYLQSVMHAWGIAKPQKLSLALANIKVVIDKKMDRKLNQAARKFYLAIAKPKPYNPTFYDVIYYNFWRAFIATGSPGDADYDYWHERGWFKQNYYYTEGVSAPRRAIGGLAFAVMSKIFAKNSKKVYE